uniref:Uncharacterized protein n=1 Tax=Salix viminalis TaxID=40686 RepID=A0A6N2LD64_SALVM
MKAGRLRHSRNFKVLTSEIISRTAFGSSYEDGVKSSLFSPTSEVKKGTKQGNLAIPAKMEVHVPALALHFDPQIWGDDV